MHVTVRAARTTLEVISRDAIGSITLPSVSLRSWSFRKATRRRSITANPRASVRPLSSSVYRVGSPSREWKEASVYNCIEIVEITIKDNEIVLLSCMYSSDYFFSMLPKPQHKFISWLLNRCIPITRPYVFKEKVIDANLFQSSEIVNLPEVRVRFPEDVDCEGKQRPSAEGLWL